MLVIQLSLDNDTLGDGEFDVRLREYVRLQDAGSTPAELRAFARDMLTGEFPDESIGWLLLASNALDDADEVKAAVARFAALAADDDPEMLLAGAELLYEVDAYDELQELLGRLTEMIDTSDAYHVAGWGRLAGMVAWHRDRADTAERFLTWAYRALPDDAQTAFSLGWFYAVTDRFAEAERVALEGLAHEPEDEQLRALLASARARDARSITVDDPP